MRGRLDRQAKMPFGVTTEDFVPPNHPIRRIRALVDRLLEARELPHASIPGAQRRVRRHGEVHQREPVDADHPGAVGDVVQ